MFDLIAFLVANVLFCVHRAGRHASSLADSMKRAYSGADFAAQDEDALRPLAA